MQQSPVLERVTLRHPLVALEPLGQEHAEDLAVAAGEGDLWQRAWYTTIPAPDEVPAEIDRRLARHEAGEMVPFAIVADGRAVGMTTYGNIDTATPRVEIGWTWMALSAQGAGINPPAKLLLLERAFEVLGCTAVEFRTHWHNRQSRAAIERLGARLDGVLRSHQVYKGTLRDTVVYSIIASEWPSVRRDLEARIEARAARG